MTQLNDTTTQGHVSVLHDWPDNEFVEDEERREDADRVFREEWDLMRASRCMGDNMGDYYRMNGFDHESSDEEDDEEQV